MFKVTFNINNLIYYKLLLCPGAADYCNDYMYNHTHVLKIICHDDHLNERKERYYNNLII